MPQTTSRLRSLLLGPSASRGTDLGHLIFRLGFGLTLGLALAGSASTLESYRRAEAQVRRGLDALGGPEALAEAGGLSIEGEGWLDLSTRMQGAHPDRPDRVPATRLLAFDPATGRVGFESHAAANPDADEWVRFVHEDATGEAGMLIVLPLEGRAFRVPGDPEQRHRTLRAVPHVLLADALERRRTLRRVDGTDGEEAVVVTLESGHTLTLFFDPDSDHLEAFEYLLDLPLRGDTTVRWEYLPHRVVPGLGAYPSGHRVLLGERPLEEIRYTAVRAGGAGAAVLGVPEGIEPPPPADPPPADPPPPTPEPGPRSDAGPPPPALREIADGVHLVQNVRGGFHPLVVELADAVVVVDAPAGFHELQTVPAIDWAGDVTSSSVGRRLLAAVRAVAPGKPIHLVLTHHHGDHAGGVRPFLAAGATIHASAVTAEVVRRAARAPFTLEPDELTGRQAEPDIRVVAGETTLSDGERSVRILDVGENPHAEGMLVVHLPAEGILYQADLFVPSGGHFPDPARLPVMRWFVDWLDSSGLDPREVWSIHGSARVTDEQLDRIRSGEDGRPAAS